MRYATLLVLVTLAVGGCVAAPGGPGSPTAATDGDETPMATPHDETDTQPSDGGTSTPACEEASVTTADPVRKSVTPSPLPDRPTRLNATTAESLATAYERAYRRNTELDEYTTQLEVSTRNASVERVDGGYVVTLTAIWWSNLAGTTTGTNTPTVAHGDGPEYRVAYYVTGDRLRRDSALDDGELTPREGTIVECWSTE